MKKLLLFFRRLLKLDAPIVTPERRREQWEKKLDMIVESARHFGLDKNG